MSTQTYVYLHPGFFCLLPFCFPAAKSQSRTEGSLAFEGKLNKAIADLNQWIELRQVSKEKSRRAEETAIKKQVKFALQFSNYFFSCDP